MHTRVSAVLVTHSLPPSLPTVALRSPALRTAIADANVLLRVAFLPMLPPPLREELTRCCHRRCREVDSSCEEIGRPKKPERRRTGWKSEHAGRSTGSRHLLCRLRLSQTSKNPPRSLRVSASVVCSGPSLHCSGRGA